MKNLLIISILLVPAITGLSQAGQDNIASTAGRQIKIQTSASQPGIVHLKWNVPARIRTMDNNTVSGMLQEVDDSSILVTTTQPGGKTRKEMEINYLNVRDIKIRKHNGLVKGFLAGFIIGASPILGGLTIGQGEGSAYVTMVTLPVGVITGTLIGAFRKRFRIDGDAQSFEHFKKRLR